MKSFLAEISVLLQFAITKYDLRKYGTLRSDSIKGELVVAGMYFPDL